VTLDSDVFGPPDPLWHGFATPDHMAESLVREAAGIIADAVHARGAALVAFPGGRSPVRAFEFLGPRSSGWSGVTIIPTDDRLVPPGDPLSNFGLLERFFAGGRRSCFLSRGCVQAILKRPDPRQRLNLALIVECAFRRPDRLADHLPRHMQIPRDRLDRLTTGILAPNPNHCLQNQHPDLAA
jgi:hypothetical protein